MCWTFWLEHYDFFIFFFLSRLSSSSLRKKSGGVERLETVGLFFNLFFCGREVGDAERGDG